MQAVVIHLKKVPEIQKVRKKYDTKNFIRPHITLVYPFSRKNGEQIVEDTLKQFKPFEIRLKKIRRSTQGHYLLLSPTKGEKRLHEIRKALYKSLKLKWNMPFRYRPHVTLGRFQTKKEIDNALKQVKPLDVPYKVDCISYIEVNKNHKLLYEKKIRL